MRRLESIPLPPDTTLLRTHAYAGHKISGSGNGCMIWADIELATHLSVDELEQYYSDAYDSQFPLGQNGFILWADSGELDELFLQTSGGRHQLFTKGVISAEDERQITTVSLWKRFYSYQWRCM